MNDKIVCYDSNPHKNYIVGNTRVLTYYDSGPMKNIIGKPCYASEILEQKPRTQFAMLITLDDKLQQNKILVPATNHGDNEDILSKLRTAIDAMPITNSMAVLKTVTGRTLAINWSNVVTIEPVYICAISAKNNQKPADYDFIEQVFLTRPEDLDNFKISNGCTDASPDKADRRTIV